MPTSTVTEEQINRIANKVCLIPLINLKDPSQVEIELIESLTCDMHIVATALDSYLAQITECDITNNKVWPR